MLRQSAAKQAGLPMLSEGCSLGFHGNSIFRAWCNPQKIFWAPTLIQGAHTLIQGAHTLIQGAPTLIHLIGYVFAMFSGDFRSPIFWRIKKSGDLNFLDSQNSRWALVRHVEQLVTRKDWMAPREDQGVRILLVDRCKAWSCFF